MSSNVRDSLIATPLNTNIVGSRILVYEEIASTNDRALALGGEGTVVIADRQTAGRGRHGRVWDSKPGLGLWFSVSFESDLPGLAFAAPLAVQSALARYCQADLKWPNDLLLAGRKVCGIMAERRNGITALGVGINVSHRDEDFPPELRQSAVSIASHTGKTLSRAELFRSVLTELDRQVIVLQSGQFQSVWRTWSNACQIRGRTIQCGKLCGVVNDVDTDGGLVVMTPHGTERIVFGEIVEQRGA